MPDGPEIPEGAEEFVASLEEYTPTIPDVLTEYYLTKSGFSQPETRLTRLISLAAQKFVSDIAEEANWYTAQRQQINQKAKQEQGFDIRDKRKVLTTEDLAAAIKEYGVNIKKPMYYADNVPGGAGGSAGAGPSS
mmetsp:Transcript_15228/g.32809  ORF Transcript_15228/g.32809 Transcript_15228/m.32809 type:complete len:135 (+) Transcript_15228:334-738(+)|eukprot:CAMPEP_0118934672 /NCGR_PEP_ID=MMETSP1169-20130426/13954_1 /TAXON_ID=36882 /ORGANISM="Pyramimonas obovata, Strain CCMP722" /LENGTH=134 /DNA_ID=CAMNT_0006877599 /DNA_START=328 /DNA_END=732 /DNA_ORIENTATION=-